MSEPTSSGQHVLMKDQSKIKHAVRRTTIVVNSRDRNYLTYPNSNNFRYTLRRALTNVMSIELMNGVVPSYIYNINTPWNKFQMIEGNIIHTITLTPGLYTGSTLATHLQTKLNAIPGKQNTYTITLNPDTHKLQCSSTNVEEYSFLFYSGDQHDDIDFKTLAVLSINTPARLLGFGINDYTSDASGNIYAPIPMDTENFLNRIYLYLESDGKNLARMEMGAGRDDCFHIFYFIPGKSEYIFLDKETDHSTYTSSPAPLARIANLNISLRDEFNRPVNLNHRELSLVFEITHLE